MTRNNHCHSNEKSPKINPIRPDNTCPQDRLKVSAVDENARNRQTDNKGGWGNMHRKGLHNLYSSKI